MIIRGGEAGDKFRYNLFINNLEQDNAWDKAPKTLGLSVYNPSLKKNRG